MKRFAVYFIFLLLPLTAYSQVSITTTGPAGSYTQNFDGTFLSTATYNLTDNAAGNLGWYSFRSSANAVPNVFTADTGSSNTGEFKNYGLAGSADRALGSLASNATDTLFYGLRIQNDTGGTIRSVRVQYTGEQWRDNSNTPQTLSFAYQVSAGDITSLTAGTFTGVAGLNFVSPTNGNVGAINGNLATNRVARDQAIFVDVPAGGEIMLRWADANDTANDQGLSIDDVTVTFFVPSAAGVSVMGRVRTADGTGIGGAVLTLSGGPLEQPITVRTNPFGYYHFDNVQAGGTYLLEINSKRYTFTQPNLVIHAQDNVNDADFIAN